MSVMKFLDDLSDESIADEEGPPLFFYVLKKYSKKPKKEAFKCLTKQFRYRVVLSKFEFDNFSC